MNNKNTALLVIDIINSCAHEKCEIPELNISFFKIRKMIPKLNEFIKIYRRKINGLIIFSNTVPWQKGYLPSNINKLYSDPKVSYYTKDKSGFAEKFYLVKPEKEDILITKNQYDVFTNKELINILKSKKINNILIAGVFGDGCVLASVSGGFSRGFNFVILKDLIETTDDNVRQELLKLLKEFTFPYMYGKTISSDDFLNEWGKTK